MNQIGNQNFDNKANNNQIIISCQIFCKASWGHKPNSPQICDTD